MFQVMLFREFRSGRELVTMESFAYSELAENRAMDWMKENEYRSAEVYCIVGKKAIRIL